MARNEPERHVHLGVKYEKRNEMSKKKHNNNIVYWALWFFESFHLAFLSSNETKTASSTQRIRKNKRIEARKKSEPDTTSKSHITSRIECVCVWRHSWSNCKISNETNCVLQWQIDNRRLMKSVGWKIRRLTCVWVRTFISLLGFLSLSLSLARHCRLSVVFSVVSGLCASMYRSISHVLGSALLMCMPFDYLSVCWQQQTTYLLPN